MADSILVSAQGLTKVYNRGTEEVRALDGVTFDLQRGEFTAVVGVSGAGKTTLLHLLGCMDTPTSGELLIDGQSTRGLSDSALTRMRREQVGFVFQHFGLLPTLTVMENLTLPTLFSKKEAKAYANELLERVGLTHRRNHLPNQLSGGEMQRVAIARALINRPQVLLADEPTGNLDSANGEAILQLFHQLHRDGLTIIVVTHNPILANATQRQLVLHDGRLVP
ncbi:MAG: ABC transporter ATP-binding protein [Armatimonadetes bacterium]|nr:ABC transporter ATP-binding protein [Armatimonadota bacterium]